MSDHREGLRRALGALRIHDAVSFSWFGERVGTAPRDVGEWPERVLWEVLTARVRMVLYTSFFAQGTPVPSVDRRLAPTALGRTDMAEALAAANTGHGPLQDGWRVMDADRDALAIRRQGLTIVVRRETFHSPARRPAPGTMGAIRLPAGMPHRSPGYYVALGDRLPAADAALSRVYWNLRSAGAPAVLRALADRLNRGAIPFEFKALSDSSAYVRCDAGVLYVARADLDSALDAARDIAARHSDALKPAVPAFTERLAPGLAWADDPGGGESFGLHRCGLVADAVVGLRGSADGDAALGHVESVFAAHGVSVAAPHRRSVMPVGAT